MTAFPLKVKWGKQEFDLTVEPALGVEVLKTQIQALTNVPPEKQKILGLPGQPDVW
jgi:hypothetical protein